MRTATLTLALLCLAPPARAGPGLPEAVDDLQDLCLSRMAVIDNLPSPTLAELAEAQALLKVWTLLGRYGGDLGKKDLGYPVKALALVGRATADAPILGAADALLGTLNDAADGAAAAAEEARDDLADPAARAKVGKRLDKALSILDSVDPSADRGRRAKTVAKAVAAYRKAEALAKKLG